MRHYILVGKQPVVCRSILEFGRWFETADRHVALTMTRHFVVSTVFLGIDHNFWGEGDPVLFETMVFARQHGSPFSPHFATGDEQGCWRHCTWDDAQRWHWGVVRMYRRKESRSSLVADRKRAQGFTLKVANNG